MGRHVFVTMLLCGLGAVACGSGSTAKPQSTTTTVNEIGEPDYAAYAKYIAEMPWKGEKPRTANEQQLRDSYGPARLKTICTAPSAGRPDEVPTVEILEQGALPLVALLCGRSAALAAIDLATQSNPTAKPDLLAALDTVERYRR